MRQRATNGRDANARQREEQALELRRAGCNYREIGAALGCNPGTAHKTVKRAIDRQLAKVADLSAEVQHLELDRLDRMLRGIWPQASQGSVQAIDRVLKIMERRAKLLGLDAPTKVAPTRSDGDDLEPAPSGLFIVPAQAATVDAWLQQVQSARPNPTK